MLGLAGAAAVLLFVAWFFRTVHPFLARTDRIEARYLVVEGWIPDYALEAAAREFRQGAYSLVLTTGGPLDYGSFLSPYASYADCAAAGLRRMGLSSNVVVSVPTTVRHRNRTYSSALALRAYGEAHGIRFGSINLVSLGAHARRSRLCFRRALGPSVGVGILSIPNRDYDPDHWWRFSEGVKTVGGELLGIAYAGLAVDYGS